MVGFLGLVIFLALQTRNQQRTIDALVVKLEERMDQQVELEHLRAQLLDFEQRFDMITTVAAGLYPLRAPQGASEADPLAPRGVMYVCANHQQWYLHLQNLQPTPRGQAYFLWFLTDEGPVEMKNFRVETFGQRVQFRRTSMPPKTHGVVLSMQPMGDAPQRPGGAVVLSGDHSIKL